MWIFLLPGHGGRLCEGTKGRGQCAAAYEAAGLKGSPQIQEFLIDDGRPTIARFSDGRELALPVRVLASEVVQSLDALAELEESNPDCLSSEPLALIVQPTQHSVPSSSESAKPSINRRLFSRLERAGVSGTLHRISAIRDMEEHIVGLTIRVGRHMRGSSWPVTDVLARISIEDKYKALHRATCGDASSAGGLPSSVLIIGGPATGKTTLLRDIACQLSTRFQLGRRVIIVDSSNEIGGQGRVRVSHAVYLIFACFVSFPGASLDLFLTSAFSRHHILDLHERFCTQRVVSSC
jgi:hypothetical protein